LRFRDCGANLALHSASWGAIHIFLILAYFKNFKICTNCIFTAKTDRRKIPHMTTEEAIQAGIPLIYIDASSRSAKQHGWSVQGLKAQEAQLKRAGYEKVRFYSWPWPPKPDVPSYLLVKPDDTRLPTSIGYAKKELLKRYLFGYGFPPPVATQ
jgi:hypothetical protein